MSSSSACKVFFFSQTGAGKSPALPYLHSTVHRDVQYRDVFKVLGHGLRKEGSDE